MARILSPTMIFWHLNSFRVDFWPQLLTSKTGVIQRVLPQVNKILFHENWNRLLPRHDPRCVFQGRTSWSSHSHRKWVALMGRMNWVVFYDPQKWKAALHIINSTFLQHAFTFLTTTFDWDFLPFALSGKLRQSLQLSCGRGIIMIWTVSHPIGDLPRIKFPCTKSQGCPRTKMGNLCAFINAILVLAS